MASRIRTLFLSLFFLSAACNLPGMVGTSPLAGDASSGQYTHQVIVQAPPGSTATATPFMPLPVTPTYLPTDFPTPAPSNTARVEATATPRAQVPIAKTWDDYPGPTIWPDIELPAPVGILPQPEGQINILLLGSDQRPSDGGFRTDTILLVTLNPNTGTANITSFPRDLYVYIPGWTVQRINTAFAHDGFELLALTLEYNFGVSPDYYALINFWSFSDMVDSLGGIDVYAATSLTDHRDGYGQYTVGQGVRHMDGETALWYVRSRHSSSDFDRGRRQQEVIQAIFSRILSLDGISRAPQLYDAYRRNVATNISFEDIAPLLPLAADLGADTALIHHYFIGPQQVTNFRNSVGSAVLLPNREAVLEVMRKALNISQ